jgi:glycogen operon protein
MSNAPSRPGLRLTAGGARFVARSREAEALTLCLFDGERETRLPMSRGPDGVFVTEVQGLREGARYGLRADGPWAPDQGLWFDPEKLLVDPYAVELDRRFAYDDRLALPRGSGVDTAPLAPKAVARRLTPLAHTPPHFHPGGLIYELNVKGFTRLRRDLAPELRGRVCALGDPAIVAHLKKLRVSAVELMPIVAWIDERQLARAGLRNAWGYNPVAMMALDPGLAPGGVAELAGAVAALHDAGIGVILDLVFNHTGEADTRGPTLSLRGLDNRTWYRHAADRPGVLVNDTGCGNTLAGDQPEVRALILDALRHFTLHAGIDGFRLDLAPVLARDHHGFDPNSPLFADIAGDPILHDRVFIAEPWDIGPGGYQLGAFPASFLEWNDRYRDDVRRYWRGDAGMLGALATRVCGSSDIFGARQEAASRTVNFIAAHDGFTLADLGAYEERHNEANGEQNRDGHGENFSWNHGVEGPTDDPAIASRRAADARALLATLFFSRGAIMLTAGDEFGHTQGGNNNAYAQDNPTTWLDWEGRDLALEDFTADLATVRGGFPALAGPAFLLSDARLAEVVWLGLDGGAMTPADWMEASGVELRLTLVGGESLSLSFDRDAGKVSVEYDLKRGSGDA